MVILFLVPVKIGKKLICRDLVTFFLHKLVVVVSQAIFVVSTVFVGHGIVPSILDWVVDLICIFLCIEHELAHFFTKRCYQFPRCFLVDEVAIKTIVFSKVNEFTCNREGAILILLQSGSKLLLVGNAIRPVEKECSINRNSVAVACINDIWSWN